MLIVELGGARTRLNVPLRKDDALLGMIAIYRQEVRPLHATRQIALLENFAAQAVIAMENARLLNEVRQRQEELRITFENMGDGVAMFDETSTWSRGTASSRRSLTCPTTFSSSIAPIAEYLRFLAERGDFGAGCRHGRADSLQLVATGRPTLRL